MISGQRERLQIRQPCGQRKTFKPVAVKTENDQLYGTWRRREIRKLIGVEAKVGQIRHVRGQGDVGQLISDHFELAQLGHARRQGEVPELVEIQIQKNQNEIQNEIVAQ